MFKVECKSWVCALGNLSNTNGFSHIVFSCIYSKYVVWIGYSNCDFILVKPNTIHMDRSIMKIYMEKPPHDCNLQHQYGANGKLGAKPK